MSNFQPLNMGNIKYQDKIYCGYFDTQGFYIDGRFHPVEIAVLSENFLFHAKVAKECPCVPSKEEKSQISYLINNHHGLKYTEGDGVNNADLTVLIKEFHESSAEGLTCDWAVRSKEAEIVLRRLDIPCVNINERYDATFKKIDKKNLPCYLHDPQWPRFKCSLNIVQYMKQYVDYIKLTARDEVG